MSETEPTSTDASEPLDETVAGEPAGMPRWKLLMLGLAGVLVVAGGGLMLWDTAFGEEAEVATSSDTARNPATLRGQTSLVGGSGFPGGEAGTRPPDGGTGDQEVRNVSSDGEFRDWAPALMTGGVSFFVGFCIGYGLRAFLKVSAIILGVIFVSVFALAYFEIIIINQEMMEKYYTAAVERVSAQLTNFRGFITGSLPSAGLAGLGLFTGFKRK